MSIEKLPDDCLVRYYESVRNQVQADQNRGGRYRFVGEAVKQYAQRLRDEIDRRRLDCHPIDWQVNLREPGVANRSASFDD
jgi:hypothetical protein